MSPLLSRIFERRTWWVLQDLRCRIGGIMVPPTRSFASQSRTGIHASSRFTLIDLALNAKRPLSSKLPLVKMASLAGVGVGLSIWLNPLLTVHCDNALSPKPSPQVLPSVDYPPPPSSSVSLYELGFGTMAGLCAGVFVKKGAKAVAWFLGGIFVLLQYLGSTSLVKVDWQKISRHFTNHFHSRDAAGNSKPPTIISLWTWIIDFLTADFQPRASFIAGFALGLRIG